MGFGLRERVQPTSVVDEAAQAHPLLSLANHPSARLRWSGPSAWPKGSVKNNLSMSYIALHPLPRYLAS